MNYKNYVKTGIHSRLNSVIKRSGGFNRISCAEYLKNKYHISIDDAYLIASVSIFQQEDFTRDQLIEMIKLARVEQRSHKLQLDMISAALLRS